MIRSKHRILLNRAMCVRCLDVIESRHHNDFTTCCCGNLSIDGGQDYQRIVGDLENYLDMSVVEPLLPPNKRPVRVFAISDPRLGMLVRPGSLDLAHRARSVEADMVIAAGGRYLIDTVRRDFIPRLGFAYVPGPYESVPSRLPWDQRADEHSLSFSLGFLGGDIVLYGIDVFRADILPPRTPIPIPGEILDAFTERVNAHQARCKILVSNEPPRLGRRLSCREPEPPEAALIGHPAVSILAWKTRPSIILARYPDSELTLSQATTVKYGNNPVETVLCDSQGVLLQI